ncbi:MAG: hypothetical protein QMD43_00835 [Thermodesulfovibrio sp.]|jgi:hypothetical protein|uniref:hypothetical protein n=1 Tax=Thermodesulfovibrio sp. N1 TaxID=1871110 RepID=UPI00083B174F|nr:hypothetical protein [Thermodesulfovibrio sp. N1]MDI6713556.1 hypothetical protein [Thermodesulfovibrio sp.]ODA43458.1 hypothetical protein THER_1816 [Thermodesulfovibrio sp. N1]
MERLFELALKVQNICTDFYLAGGTANDFEKKFPTQSYKIYLGNLLNFEDYPELPMWVKEILGELV